MAIDPGTLDRIRSDYPAFASLLDIPDIANLLARAAKEGWDIGKLQANLFNTSWWRTHSESQRNAAILYRTDRASYNRQVGQIAANIRSEANRLGAQLSAAEVNYMAAGAFNAGMEPQEITRKIVELGRKRAWGAGEIARTGDQIIALSKAYGVPIGKTWADTYASRIAFGEKTMEAVQADFQNRALNKYANNSQVKQGLLSGQTLLEVVEPTLNLVADELEMGSMQWDLNEGLAQKVINYKDVDSGELRIMTDSEAVQLARSDRRWRDTNRGKTLVTDATNAIARFMGQKV